MTDLSERPQFEAWLRSVIATSFDATVVAGADTALQWMSPSMERLFGYEPGTLIGVLGLSLVHDDDSALVSDAVGSILPTPGGHTMVEFRLRAADGSYRWVQETIVNRLHDPHVLGIVGNVRDITEQKRAAEAAAAELRWLAYYDSLTGLKNRNGLLEPTTTHDAAPAGAAVIGVLGVDSIIDSFGHATGDAVIAHIAGRIEATAQQLATTASVARIGGARFALLIGTADSEGLDVVVDRICQQLTEPLSVAGLDVTFQVRSFAGLSSSCSTRDAGDLLEEAESAARRAKESRRSPVERYRLSLRTDAAERLLLAGDLHRALLNGDIHVRYQPIVSLPSGAPLGAEALARWTHPRKGAITPDVFIPIAEETGLIAELGAYVLRRACAAACLWPTGPGAPLYLSVNISATQLLSEDLSATLRQALEDSGLNPSRLLLEVTESTAMEDPEAAATAISSLKDLGVRVAIDDFGTGYSSLAWLKRLPIDALKIDRQFVSGLEDDPDAVAIAASIISLAATVGVDVIAEGVESHAQAATLHRLGCSAAQGFLWSPAITHPFTTTGAIARHTEEVLAPPV